MTEELLSADGISRRDMLKRSAIVGGAGALVWAAPSVTTFGGRAFGSTSGTPSGKGISYIALRYSCDTNAEGAPIYRYIKFDDYNEATDSWTCTNNVNLATNQNTTPGCTVGWGSDPNKDMTSYNDCGKFTLVTETDADGEPVKVTVCLSGEGHDCIIDGVAYGKCGAPDVDASGGECLQRQAVGNCVTFDMCGA
jgi:hypothetical protein